MLFKKLIFYCTIILFMLSGCADDTESRKQKNLLIILHDDCKSIISDIKKENLADSVYFEIVTYKKFDEGKYRIKAVVDFYFLKEVPVKIVRKYRYDGVYHKWDRYFNEYKFINDDGKKN